MKGFGSAVLTALQAQHKSIDEIERLIQHRRLQNKNTAAEEATVPMIN